MKTLESHYQISTLKEHKNGFTIKASSKSGHDLYLPISAKQISEQLKAIEALP